MHTSEFWKKFLDENYHLIVRQAKKKFYDDKEAAKDACSYVYEQLCEDGCRRLRNYKKEASEKTYFCTLVRFRLMEFQKILINYRKKHPENDPDLPDPITKSSEDQLIWEQIKALVSSILQNPNEESTKDPASKKIKKSIRKIKSEFKPTSKERDLFIKVYIKGMNRTAAGRTLGWNKDQSRSRHRRLMGQLREIIPKEVLMDLISYFEN